MDAPTREEFADALARIAEARAIDNARRESAELARRLGLRSCLDDHENLYEGDVCPGCGAAL